VFFEFVQVSAVIIPRRLFNHQYVFSFQSFHRFLCYRRVSLLNTLALRHLGLCLIDMMVEQLKSDLECITGKRTIVATETAALVLARLDEMAKSVDTPERLQHYLSKRSYIKALAWIEDPSTPHHA
jgi:hypothetical protein